MIDVDEQRSRTMRAIKGRDTTPEMVVRRLTHGLGYRYRLCDVSLPGKPDLVFRSRRKIIFVHGCFWHGHNCARGSRVPKTNTEYWLKKIERNRMRDAANIFKLEADGWAVLVVWECAIGDLAKLEKKIREFLG